MKTRRIRVATTPSYEVSVGSQLLETVEATVATYSGAAVVTDENVAPLYLTRLGGLADGTVVRVDAGEASKSFATLERVLDDLAAANLDRDACLIALGGGVIGDLCGLAASLYKRGVAVVQCPTTLLSQVDASVGGKTAVNLPSGKNLAGTFHQPSAVFADVETLRTLSEEEFASGLGEVLKTALLGGEESLAELEEGAGSLCDRDPRFLVRVVERCVAFKARVVAEDPHEAGLRKCLNLGHTFAHGIEHIAGYGTVPHGVAVAAGIGVALERAATTGVLVDLALPERVQELARVLGLPASIEEIETSYGLTISEEHLIDSMRSDKKNSGGAIRLVLPRRAGEMALDVPLH